MWELAHRFWPEGSVFRYFARKPTGEVFGCAIDSPWELGQVTDWADAEGWNSYWQPNPTRRRGGTKCSTADIDFWCWFMLDIDPSLEKNTRSIVDYAEKVEHWLAFLWPSLDRLYIQSGRGLQIMYPLGLCSTEKAAQTMSYWLADLEKHVDVPRYNDQTKGGVVDTSCSDLPRVMRMPFTINQKTGRRASILAEPTGINEGLAQALIDAVPPEVFETTQPTAGNQTYWTGYKPHLTVAGRRFLSEGQVEPGRHKMAAATMLSLIEQGASQRQTLEALTFGAALCQPPLPLRDVERMVENRFKKVLTVPNGS